MGGRGPLIDVFKKTQFEFKTEANDLFKNKAMASNH
jgi:hypothetical protein